VAEGKGMAWRYQLTTDRNKYMLGTEMNVWGVINTPGSDNVKNSITLSGAISLASKATGLALFVSLSSLF
jgi:hypothetical protein